MSGADAVTAGETARAFMSILGLVAGMHAGAVAAVAAVGALVFAAGALAIADPGSGWWYAIAHGLVAARDRLG